MRFPLPPVLNSCGLFFSSFFSLSFPFLLRFRLLFFYVPILVITVFFFLRLRLILSHIFEFFVVVGAATRLPARRTRAPARGPAGRPGQPPAAQAAPAAPAAVPRASSGPERLGMRVTRGGGRCEKFRRAHADVGLTMSLFWAC